VVRDCEEKLAVAIVSHARLSSLALVLPMIVGISKYGTQILLLGIGIIQHKTVSVFLLEGIMYSTHYIPAERSTDVEY
jgi:hypothetical protein